MREEIIVIPPLINGDYPASPFDKEGLALFPL
jgi:hypothetical protein